MIIVISIWLLNIVFIREDRKTGDQINHTKMAKNLVELARGVKKDGFWEKTDGNLASGALYIVFV